MNRRGVRIFLSFLMTIAGLAIVAGCSSPTDRAELHSSGPGWQDAGTPAPSVAVERVTRYYADEQGAGRDDRGKKHDPL